jgi:probable rRNA maturation factor
MSEPAHAKGRPEVAFTGGSLDVDIVIETAAWETIEGLDSAIIGAARLAYAQGAGAPQRKASVTIALLSDAGVRALNLQFRGLDKPTNVLSFPAADSRPAVLKADRAEPRPLGDLALSHETMAAEACAEGIALVDHIRHLVVHGILHLLGHDHEDDDEADNMEALETLILAQLGVADPYAR